MVKKVGIHSLYYKNYNYGGSLQSYALCKFLNLAGYKTEQIMYDRYSVPVVQATSSRGNRLKKLLNPRKVLHFIARKKNEVLHTYVAGKVLNQRNTCIERFNQEETVHGNRVYTSQTISECTGYDAYIVGSDQVWNPDWYQMTDFLDYVPTGKKKLSYAASIGKKELTQEQQEVFREKLADFTAVSVREQDAVELLENLSSAPVVQTLDPTLLLTREQWDEICSVRIIPEKYIFTYFLGADKNQRKVAREFAKKKGLPIVTLPYLEGTFRKCDVFFGNKKLCAISPADFISLIKHAEYVLTDSFHACVFSGIYQKEYFAFQRQGHAGMGGRLYSLTKLFHSESHFCDTQEKSTVEYIENLDKICYATPRPELDVMLARSYDFLHRNLIGMADDR